MTRAASSSSAPSAPGICWRKAFIVDGPGGVNEGTPQHVLSPASFTALYLSTSHPYAAMFCRVPPT